MTTIRVLFAFLLAFVVGTANVSAQTPPKDGTVRPLPIGQSRFPITVNVQFNVWTLDPMEQLFFETMPFTATSEVAATSFIQETASQMSFAGVSGLGWLEVDIRELNGYYLNDSFEFSGGKFPSLAPALSYGAADFSFPGATGFELETEDGRVFSTLGLLGRNDFGNGCSVAASQDAITKGIVHLGSGVLSARSLIKYLKVYQGDLYETLNGDGYTTEVTSSAPSWVRKKAEEPEPKVAPLRVALQPYGGLLAIVVSGTGAERAVVEQSRDFRHWGPSVSLTKPPRKASLGGQDSYVFTVVGDESESTPVLFYRARVDASPPQNQ